MVRNAYLGLERDGGLASERLGDYGFSARADSLMTDEVLRLIEPWIDWSVGE